LLKVVQQAEVEQQKVVRVQDGVETSIIFGSTLRRPEIKNEKQG
jgi:hypothetical protein